MLIISSLLIFSLLHFLQCSYVMPSWQCAGFYLMYCVVPSAVSFSSEITQGLRFLDQTANVSSLIKILGQAAIIPFLS